ncbi:MAG: magnesium transporter [Desulfurivibrio sp.]|nr:magnesium transporter [Desulfurivibrio sp.]
MKTRAAFQENPANLALSREYVRRFPAEAAQTAGLMAKEEIARLLAGLPIQEAIPFWQQLDQSVAAMVLDDLPATQRVALLSHADPTAMARLLARLPERRREPTLAGLAPAKAQELAALVDYPEDSAGALMDIRFVELHTDLTVRQTLLRIKRYKPRFSYYLFLVNGDGVLEGMVTIHDLALSEAAVSLASLARPVLAAVLPTATRQEVMEQLDNHKLLSDLPVVDNSGKLLGVIHYDALLETVREEASVDIMTMVGASKDERALSTVGFVVKKRLPWLHINLLTAFLAASVVGVFEATIAQFTALAVLLPVVAGQSGNTGAQALAVTMRGLALREFGTSQWRRVAGKEVGAALLNSLAVALTTAAGVLVWSGSPGLCLIIATSMVISMVAAGLSGVLIPVALARLGQDPAQSSSIILTTVTDIVGFFSFLGIATLLANFI